MRKKTQTLEMMILKVRAGNEGIVKRGLVFWVGSPEWRRVHSRFFFVVLFCFVLPS